MFCITLIQGRPITSFSGCSVLSLSPVTCLPQDYGGPLESDRSYSLEHSLQQESHRYGGKDYDNGRAVTGRMPDPVKGDACVSTAQERPAVLVDEVPG